MHFLILSLLMHLLTFNILAKDDDTYETRDGIEFHKSTGYCRNVHDLIAKLGLEPAASWPAHCRETGKREKNPISFATLFDHIRGLVEFVNRNLHARRGQILSVVKKRISQGEAVKNDDIDKLNLPDLDVKPADHEVVTFSVKIPGISPETRRWTEVKVKKQDRQEWFSCSGKGTRLLIINNGCQNIDDLKATYYMSQAIESLGSNKLSLTHLIKSEAYFSISLLSEIDGILEKLVKLHEQILFLDADIERLEYVASKSMVARDHYAAQSEKHNHIEAKKQKEADLNYFLSMVESVYREPTKKQEYWTITINSLSQTINRAVNAVMSSSREESLRMYFHPHVTVDGIRRAYQNFERYLRKQSQEVYQEHIKLMQMIFGQHCIIPTEQEFAEKQPIADDRFGALFDLNKKMLEADKDQADAAPQENDNDSLFG